MYVYPHTYIFIYTHIYTHIYIHIYMYLYIHNVNKSIPDNSSRSNLSFPQEDYSSARARETKHAHTIKWVGG